MRHREVYEAIRKCDEAGEPAVLATVVRVRGSAPGSIGSKMLVTGSGRMIGTVGGGCVDGQVFAEARKVFEDELPRTITVDLTGVDAPDEHQLICGGKVDVFLEPLVSPHLYICGSGHIALALAPIARKLEFKVTVIDDRAQFNNAARFPDAERIVAPFSETLAKLRAKAPAYVCVVTRGHAQDQECLEWALAQDARYVGLVGSKVKIKKIVERAVAKGFPQDRLDRVRAPIGLDVGAVTVDEIAVAIAAELVAVRRLGTRIARTLERRGDPCSNIALPPKVKEGQEG